MYGVEFLREYDESDPEHVSRKDRMCELPSGPKLLADAFDCILARVRLIEPVPSAIGAYIISVRTRKGIDDLRTQVLHRSHQPLHSLRLRSRNLVLPRTGHNRAEMDQPQLGGLLHALRRASGSVTPGELCTAQERTRKQDVLDDRVQRGDSFRIDRVSREDQVGGQCEFYRSIRLPYHRLTL